MKLTVKTLKGGKFEVDCEPSQSVADVKGIIEKANSELPAASLKLIHSGKVLKDDQTIESCGIKANDFLVVMVTKAKKAAAAAPAPAAPAPAPVAAEAPKTPAPASTEVAETPAPAASAPGTVPAAPSRPSEPEFPQEVIDNLMGMGFPEPEVRFCLRAANGNPDFAVEFLMNGIPPGIQADSEPATPAANSSSTPASSSGGPLASLRSHPQFNDLRRLVQTNPQMLQTVLTQIGQQQPELLAEINANQEAFLAMMNEPISESSSSRTTSSTSTAPSSSSSAPSGLAASLGLPAGLADSMANPAQMAQLIQNMGPNELNQMAQMMGLSPEQLRATAQMLGQIPPEQLQMYMSQAMQGGGAGLGSLMGGAGGGGAGGGGAGQQHVLRLTDEENAAVNRLTDMGFDFLEAAQAFLACDKNEALAANLLMDSMADRGFGDDDNGHNDDGDDGDDMYD